MKIIFKSVVLVLFFSSITQAQNQHLTPATLGVGGAGVAHISDYNSNFLNPANLMLPSRTRLSFGFAGLSNSTGGGLANIGLYNKYFTKDLEFDAELSKKISDEWFGTSSGSTIRFGLNLDIVPVGFSYRMNNQAFSLATRARVIGTAKMNKGFFDLGLNGFDSNVFGDFRDVNFSNSLIAISEVSVGYARKVYDNGRDDKFGTVRIYAGVAPKYVMGFAGVSFDFNSSLRVSSDPNKIEHNFNYIINASGDLAEKIKQFVLDRDNPNMEDVKISDYLDDDAFGDAGKQQGSGLGVDLGVTYERIFGTAPLGGPFRKGAHKVVAAFSLTDLGAVNFNNNATRFSTSQNFIFEGLDVDFERIKNEFDNDFGKYIDYVFQDSIATEIYANFSTESLDKRRVQLPGMMHIGGAYHMGRAGLFMDFYKGFNSYGVNSKRLGWALGTEYRVFSFLPLRIGIRTGGHAGVGYNFGTGLDFKNFELSVSGSVVSNSESGGTNYSAVFSGLKFRF